MFVEFDNDSFLSVAGRLKSELSFGAAAWPHLRCPLNVLSWYHDRMSMPVIDGQVLCTLCGELDSLHHRLCVCSSSQSLGDALPSNVLEVIPSLPEVLSLHGWTLRSEYRDAWFRYLCSLPQEPVFQWPADLPVVLDLFTDGSVGAPLWTSLVSLLGRLFFTFLVRSLLHLGKRFHLPLSLSMDLCNQFSVLSLLHCLLPSSSLYSPVGVTLERLPSY